MSPADASSANEQSPSVETAPAGKRQRGISYRYRLMAEMLVLVAMIAGTILLLVQDRVQRLNEENLASIFETQVQQFRAAQEIRLEEIQSSLDDLARNPRLLAAMLIGEEDGFENFYYDLAQQVEPLLERYRPARPGGRRPFVRLLHVEEGYRAPPEALESMSVTWSEEAVAQALAPLGKEAARIDEPTQRAGYILIKDGSDTPELYLVTTYPLFDFYDFLGYLAFAIPYVELPKSGGQGGPRQGLYTQGMAFFAEEAHEAQDKLSELLTAGRKGSTRSVRLTWREEPCLAFFTPLGREEGFKRVEQVAIFSLTEQERMLAAIRANIAWLAGVGGLFAVGLSLVSARRLTRPIEALVQATESVREGDLTARVETTRIDEFGQLADSFNTMTTDLALKERYRAVLDKVTDRDVATALTTGKLELGGEDRVASVLFCDIRGFTPQTEGMSPREIIAMLNEHMTALTSVVHAHRGIVDKFVGDEIMAVFGVPQAYGEDTQSAARCALAMLEERRRLNETSQHHVEIGIGIATGPVVAGCMGSEERLQYTVLGARVNLAARLCSLAPSDTCLVDAATAEILQEPPPRSSPLPYSPAAVPWKTLQVKGFTDPIPVHRLCPELSAKRAQREV